MGILAQPRGFVVRQSAEVDVRASVPGRVDLEYPPGQAGIQLLGGPFASTGRLPPIGRAQPTPGCAGVRGNVRVGVYDFRSTNS